MDQVSEVVCSGVQRAWYYSILSRVRTPKDNAVDERFNRTLEDEFIALGNMTTDIAVFNTN